MRLYWAFIALILFFSIKVEAACPSLAEIRTAYFSHQKNFEATKNSLQCRREKSKEDMESLRFYSDLLWWEGEGEASRKIAHEALEQLKDDSTTELRLALKKRVSRFDVALTYQDVFSSNRTSYELEAQGSAYYWNNNKLYFRFFRDSRSFNQAAALADMAYVVGHSMPLTAKLYLEAEGQFSQDPTYLPEWVIGVAPHYVWNRFDFSVLAKFRRYEADDVYSLQPASFIDLGSRLKLRVFVDWSLKPNQSLSYSLSPRVQWTPRLESQFTFSAGTVDEGNNLLDDYLSASLRLSYWLSSSLQASLLSVIHRGDLRDENRIGGGAQFRF